MTSLSDPPRILSGRADAPAALRDAVQAAASDGPTSQQLAELASSLAPTFAAQSSALLHAGAGATRSGGASAKLFGAGKVAALAAAVAVVGGYGAWRWLRPSPSNVQNIAPAEIIEPTPEPAAPPPALPAAPVERLAVDPEPAPAPAAAPPKPRETARPKTVEPPVQDPPVVEAPKAQLASESELVDLARRSVASDPRKALALAQEHHRRFAGGPLSEEADFIEIEAMKRLGRFEEARALDERFRKRYPSSIHGQTVQVRPSPSP
jgi:hypothetical protein